MASTALRHIEESAGAGGTPRKSIHVVLGMTAQTDEDLTITDVSGRIGEALADGWLPPACHIAEAARYCPDVVTRLADAARGHLNLDAIAELYRKVRCGDLRPSAALAGA